MTNPMGPPCQATEQNTLGPLVVSSSVITSELSDGTQISCCLPSWEVTVLRPWGELRTYKTLEEVESLIPGFIQAQWKIFASSGLFQSELPPVNLQGPPLQGSPLQGAQHRLGAASAPARISNVPVLSPISQVNQSEIPSEEQQPLGCGIPESSGIPQVDREVTGADLLAGPQPPDRGCDDGLLPNVDYHPLSPWGGAVHDPSSEDDVEGGDCEGDRSFSCSSEVNALIVLQGGQLLERGTPITSPTGGRSSSGEEDGAAGLAASNGHVYFQQATPIPAPSMEEDPPYWADDVGASVSPPLTYRSSFEVPSSVASIEQELERDVDHRLLEFDPRLAMNQEEEPDD